MKNLLPLFFIFLSLGLSAQNASFGIGIGAINSDGLMGTFFTGNVRAQLSDRFGWQTEVGYADFNQQSSIMVESPLTPSQGTGIIIESRESGAMAFNAKTALTAKIFTVGGLTTEAIVGGGMYTNGGKIYGLLSGELFFSAQIGKNITAGIPLSYNYITWVREDFYTAGVSIRFHM